MNKLIFCFLLCAQIVSAKEHVDGVVATVNAEPVLISDVSKLLQRAKKPDLIDESIMTTGNLEKLKTDSKEQLSYLINEKIIDSEIKRLNLSVTDERINAEIRDNAKRAGLSVDQMSVALRNQGLSMEDYRAILKQKIERHSLFETEIISKLRITDEEAYSTYTQRNPHAKGRAFEYTISQIFFNPSKGSPEKALERAEGVLKRIHAGESFEKVAEATSEDTSFSNGGSLGTFKSGEFSPEFEQAVKGLEAGQTSKIVQSRRGFHVLKLTSKKTILDPGFEKEKERIKAALFEVNFKRQLKTWLESKREDYIITTKEKK